MGLCTAAATRRLQSFSKDVNKASRVSAQITVAIYPAAAFIVPFFLFEILELLDEGDAAASAKHTKYPGGGECPGFYL